MTAERVTVSLPAQLRQSVQHVADEAGMPFSSVVAEALTGWMRGQLVDVWLAEYEEEHGAFDEDELRRLADESGVPYVPPGRPTRVVA